MKTLNSYAAALTLVLILAGVNTRASADGKYDFSVSEQDAALLRTTQNKIRLGVSVGYFDYKEDLTAPAKSTEYGMIPAYTLSYELHPVDHSWFFAAEGALSDASIRYDGSTQRDYRPVKHDTDATMTDIRLTGGLTIPGASRLLGGRFAVFAGIGRYFWGRGGGIHGNVLSLKEDYSWYYVPTGVSWTYDATSRLSLGAEGMASWMFGGKMTVALSQMFRDGVDSTTSLGNKVGFTFKVPASYQITGGLRLFAAPWYQYSAIGQSPDFKVELADETVIAYEPASRTHRYGAHFGTELSF